MAAKRNHHIGNCHQPGYSAGEKLTSMLEKTRQGRAISMASRVSKPRTFSGMIPLLAIQNPMSPIPRSTSTDCSTMIKISILSIPPQRKWILRHVECNYDIGDGSGAGWCRCGLSQFQSYRNTSIFLIYWLPRQNGGSVLLRILRTPVRHLR